MADVPFPAARPRQWRVPRVLVVLFAFILLAMNWSVVLDTAQSLSNDAHNCRTKLGKAADRIVAFVLQGESQCESHQSDPFPLGIP